MHRATGIFLSLGFMVFTIWLFCLLDNSYPKTMAASFFSGIIVKLLIIAWSFSFFYHFANGIRHLVWDAGYGFEKKQIYSGGIFVIVFSFLTTILFLYSIF